MINLSVTSIQQEGCPTIYQCSPSQLLLGYQNSSGMETLQISLPQEWSGMNAVITWIPQTGSPLAQAIPADGAIAVTSALTAASGTFEVSACGVSDTVRSIYSAGGKYQVFPHPPTEGQAPTVPLNLYEQFIAKMDGIRGPAGPAGKNGLSAYEVAVAGGFIGNMVEWLANLKGETGQNGTKGETGSSAYEAALSEGFSGTESAWLASLKGSDGAAGRDGKNGLSAYELAVAGGFTGTSEEWTASLKGAAGAAGTSATIAIGQTSLLPAGSVPAVSNSGTAQAAVLDFAFPASSGDMAASVYDPQGCKKDVFTAISDSCASENARAQSAEQTLQTAQQTLSGQLDTLTQTVAQKAAAGSLPSLYAENQALSIARLVIRSGTVSVPVSTAESTNSFVFPAAFPAGCLAVIPIMRTGYTTTFFSCAVTALSTTGFSLACHANEAYTMPLQYLAIGY